MKMIFGAIYKKKNVMYEHLNDQHYGIYIPVKFTYKRDDSYFYKKGQVIYKMVDTYMIHNPCYGKADMEKRLWFLEQANDGETAGKICFDHNDYFYQNISKLDSDELDENEWELIADLHDYKRVTDDDSRDYCEEDVIRFAPLWNEDCYRWDSGIVGANYVKKSAKKDGNKIYYHILDKIPFTFTYDFELNELERTCKDILANMQVKRGMKKNIKNTLKKIKKYRSISKEFKDYCESLNYIKDHPSDDPQVEAVEYALQPFIKEEY